MQFQSYNAQNKHTQIMVSDQKARVSLAHRTDFALANCGQLLANTSLMTGLKSVGFDAVMGDVSVFRESCALIQCTHIDLNIGLTHSYSDTLKHTAV